MALVVAFVAAVTTGQMPLNVLQLLWVNLIMDALAALGVLLPLGCLHQARCQVISDCAFANAVPCLKHCTAVPCPALPCPAFACFHHCPALPCLAHPSITADFHALKLKKYD